jgi:DNA primase
MLIHKAQGKTNPAVYVSIGGVSNQQAIDRLKRKKLAVVLAVDNDSAGDECRQRNPDLTTLIPYNNDWNDDLRQMLLP